MYKHFQSKITNPLIISSIFTKLVHDSTDHNCTRRSSYKQFRTIELRNLSVIDALELESAQEIYLT